MEGLWQQLTTVLKTMDVPEKRKSDINWLARNLFVRNKNHVDYDKAWTQQKHNLVTTELLGKAKTPNLPYMDHDGSALKIDTDYFGNKRKTDNPFPGPFKASKQEKGLIKV